MVVTRRLVFAGAVASVLLGLPGPSAQALPAGSCFVCQDGYDQNGYYTHIDYLWFNSNNRHGGQFHNAITDGECSSQHIMYVQF